MDWIKLKDIEPTEKDIPFITWGLYSRYEVWEDTDWFCELTPEERTARVEYWYKLTSPIHLKNLRIKK